MGAGASPPYFLPCPQKTHGSVGARKIIFYPLRHPAMSPLSNYAKIMYLLKECVYVCVITRINIALTIDRIFVKGMCA